MPVLAILSCLLFSCLVMSNSFVTPGTVAPQAPLSMGFPRQEYWKVKLAQLCPTLQPHGLIESMEFSRLKYWIGWPFPSPRDVPNPRLEPRSPTLQADFFYQLSHKGRPRVLEWVAYPFSRGSSWLRNRTHVSCIGRQILSHWAPG